MKVPLCGTDGCQVPATYGGERCSFHRSAMPLFDCLGDHEWPSLLNWVGANIRLYGASPVVVAGGRCHVGFTPIRPWLQPGPITACAMLELIEEGDILVSPLLGNGAERSYDGQHLLAVCGRVTGSGGETKLADCHGITDMGEIVEYSGLIPVQSEVPFARPHLMFHAFLEALGADFEFALENRGTEKVVVYPIGQGDLSPASSDKGENVLQTFCVPLFRGAYEYASRAGGAAVFRSLAGSREDEELIYVFPGLTREGYPTIASFVEPKDSAPRRMDRLNIPYGVLRMAPSTSFDPWIQLVTVGSLADSNRMKLLPCFISAMAGGMFDESVAMALAIGAVLRGEQLPYIQEEPRFGLFKAVGSAENRAFIEPCREINEAISGSRCHAVAKSMWAATLSLHGATYSECTENTFAIWNDHAEVWYIQPASMPVTAKVSAGTICLMRMLPGWPPADVAGFLKEVESTGVLRGTGMTGKPGLPDYE